MCILGCIHGRVYGFGTDIIMGYADVWFVGVWELDGLKQERTRSKR